MEYTPELKTALHELEEITGIQLNVKADTEEETVLALTQIRCLCQAYREKYNRNHFLQNLLTGKISPCNAAKQALRLHIPPKERRVLFLLETKKESVDTVTTILRQLFPAQTKTFFVTMSEQRVVVLRSLKSSETDADILQTAHTIVDTLNTEALTFVQIAYSTTGDTLTDLADMFRETSLTLDVGKIFYPEQKIFSCNRLGVGRLLYHLPVSVCKSFLEEIFGTNFPSFMDEELSLSIDKFLQNNLNVSETARQLHMHRNTLLYRLEQLQKRTGLDLRNFEDAMTFKIASMIMHYLERNL